MITAEDIALITDKNQVKALILIISSELSQVSSDELISSVLATDLVSITNITDAFEQLISDGLLGLNKNADGAKACTVTEKGKSILSELELLLPAGIREQAKRSAARFYKANKSAEEYFSKIKKESDGYTLTCVHTVHKAEVCRVTLHFATEKEAVLAKNNFELRPETVIANINAAVTGKVEYLL